MRKWALSAVAFLLMASICFTGCSGTAKASKDVNSPSPAKAADPFLQKTEVINKTEDGVMVRTAIPVFSGFSGAEKLNKEIQKISVDGIAEVKEQAKELGNSAAAGHLYFISFYDSFLDGDVLSVRIYNENYTGGAHGFRWIRTFNVNIKTRETYETAGALFKDPQAGTKQITDKILADIKRHPELYFPEAAQTVEALKGKYPFYLDGQNLIVYFQLYDIAPYAAGIPEFVFPLKDLQTKMPLGGHTRGDIRLNGKDIQFTDQVVSNQDGDFLPLNDTAKALSLTVTQKDGKYFVDGKAVKPVMMDGKAYLPLETFNELLKDAGKNGFVVFDGQILRMFADDNTGKEIRLGYRPENEPSSAKSSSPAAAKQESKEIKKIGYIKKFDAKAGTIAFDEVEWLTAEDDKARLKELGQNPDDLPDGYYIYNSSKKTENLKLSDKVEYLIINYGNAPQTEKSDAKELAKTQNQIHKPLHHPIQGNQVVQIEEQYVP